VVNHCRTLLLNQAREAYGAETPGEEVVPAEFRPRRLGSAAARVRAALFGEQPDRYRLNYRLAQLMPFVHASDLHPVSVADDPRLTYWPPTATWQPFAGVAGAASARARTAEAEAGDLAVTGAFVGDGPLLHRWRVTRTAADEVEVRRLAVQAPPTTLQVSFPGNRSEQFPLDGTGLAATLAGAEGASWEVTAVLIPRPGLVGVLARLDRTLSDAVALDLFVGPYGPDLRRAWRSHPEPETRLAAACLGLAAATAAAPEA
jgi:hypothetical protein